MLRAAPPRWAPSTVRAAARSCCLGLLDVGLTGLAHSGGEDLLHARTRVDRAALALRAVERGERRLDAQLGADRGRPLKQALGRRGGGKRLATPPIEQRPVLPQ